MGPFLTAIAPSLIGGLASVFGKKDQNKAAAAQAKRQMDFQERMSSTAHQREVKDLRAAGLNPILSATGGSGASSPGGAQAPVVDELTPAISTAMQASRLALELKQIRASTKAADTQADANSARALLSRRQAGSIAPVSVVGEAIGGAASSVLQPFSQGTPFRKGLDDFFRMLLNPERKRVGSVGIRRPEGRTIYSEK